MKINFSRFKLQHHRAKNNKVKMIAHRGYSARETENSIAAFVAAGNCSQFGIETDVHCTRDGKFVIIHDDNTGRVSPVNISVEGSNYNELRRIRLYDMDLSTTRADLKIPNLKEYISVCRHYNKTGILELKNHMNSENIKGIVDIIKGTGYLSNIIFISFDMENLLTLRKMLPSQPLQFLCKKITEKDFAYIEKYKIDLDIYYKNVTHELVVRVHNMNRLVNCWTVNNENDKNWLVAAGVDFITSNSLE